MPTEVARVVALLSEERAADHCKGPQHPLGGGSFTLRGEGSEMEGGGIEREEGVPVGERGASICGIERQGWGEGECDQRWMF